MPQLSMLLQRQRSRVTAVAGVNSSPNRLDWPPSVPRSTQRRKSNETNYSIRGRTFALVAAPLTAQAQGVPGGAAHGFHEGNRIAGPVGAVVGTAVGGVIGGVEGVLGVNHRHAAHSDYADVPPPRAYKQRKAKRARRSRRGARRSRPRQAM